MRLRTIAAIAATSLLLSCNGTVNTGATTSTGSPSPGTSASTGATVGAGSGTTTGTGATTGTTTSTAPATATVTIQAFKYNPASVTVKSGGTVTFTNMDTVAHTVSPASGAAFTGSGNIAAGASATVTFPTAGTANYKCDYHASMLGSVTVQ